MVDDDHVEPGLGRGGERLVRGGAAIDRDDDMGTVGLEAQQGGRVGAVTLAQPVRHIDRGVAADCREEAQQQGRRGRAIDVVVAEHHDALALADRAHQALDRRRHVAQMRRIGQLIAQPRRQKQRRFIRAEAALRQQPADDFGQSQALGDCRCHAILGGARAPSPAAHRTLDAEKGCRLGINHQSIVTPAKAGVQGEGNSNGSPGFPLSRE